MRKIYPFIVIVSLLISACNQESTAILTEDDSSFSLQEGYWKGSLELQNHPLHFDFYVNSSQKITVLNGEERVEMNLPEIEEDSLVISFSSYANYFKIALTSSEEMKGYFYNPDLGARMQFPLEAHYIGMEKPVEVEKVQQYTELDGKWQTRFRPGADNEYPAIGYFQQINNEIKGTFLKRSGDARFLTGKIDNNKLYFHSFDGAYATIYTAELIRDTLYGKVFNSNEGMTDWLAFRNDDFELESPESITYLVDDSFELNVKTTAGEDFSFPNQDLDNKVVIIQITGTWCPNCLDETVFFKELYEKYNKDGLEIISIAYERPKTFEEQAARIERYVNHVDIPYPVLVGGSTSDNKVAEDFYMLNRISAYPTSIFINRKGDVTRIQTGFSGPGTGELHEELKREIEGFVVEMLE